MHLLQLQLDVVGEIHELRFSPSRPFLAMPQWLLLWRTTELCNLLFSIPNGFGRFATASYVGLIFHVFFMASKSSSWAETYKDEGFETLRPDFWRLVCSLALIKSQFSCQQIALDIFQNWPIFLLKGGISSDRAAAAARKEKTFSRRCWLLWASTLVNVPWKWPILTQSILLQARYKFAKMVCSLREIKICGQQAIFAQFFHRPFLPGKARKMPHCHLNALFFESWAGGRFVVSSVSPILNGLLWVKSNCGQPKVCTVCHVKPFSDPFWNWSLE